MKDHSCFVNSVPSSNLNMVKENAILKWRLLSVVLDELHDMPVVNSS